MNINEVAQWVIDNRYPKSEFEKLSDHELYYGLIEKIELVLKQNSDNTNVLRSLLAEITRCRSEADKKKTEWGNGMSEHAIESRVMIMLCDHLLGFIQQ